MASFADLKKHLLEGVSSRVEQHGFKYRKSGQHYVKAFSGGILSLHLAFINHDEDFDVTADVAVRHSAVEQIVNQAVAYLGDRQKARTFTVGAELGSIQRSGQKRWTVANHADVAVVADAILAEFVDVGLPFLDRYVSAEETYQVLRRDDDESRLICPIPSAREERINAFEECRRTGA